MNTAICKTCGDTPDNHKPSVFDKDGIGHPDHAMNASTNSEREDEELLLILYKLRPRLFQNDETPMERVTEVRKAYTAILARQQQKVTEIEKAYGGCHNCYGKGYATVNDRWHGHDTDMDIGSAGGYVTGGNANAMKFCKCDRGEQLAALKEKQ